MEQIPVLKQEEQVYFLLGKLVSEQELTLDIIKRHIEEDSKKWDHIYSKTDKIQDFVKYLSGAIAVVATACGYFLHKVLGI